MNRHAFLIMAHNHFDFLKILLKRLDDPRNDIYLHVDRKAADFSAREFDSLLSYSQLYFTERMDVHWGGYSQTACEYERRESNSRAEKSAAFRSTCR